MRCIFCIFVIAIASRALAAEPATKPSDDPTKLPFVHLDMTSKQVRIDCEEIDCRNPLEFFSVVAGTSEHEAVLRTKAKPSHVHLALLMLGLEPGKSVRYSEADKKWLPPEGPRLHISCEFEKDGKKVVVPAYRMMRDLKTKKEMPPMSWIFVGSRVMPDGNYAADITGYVVSLVNFELTLIDIPDLASSANETLEWQINTDIAPKGGTPVTMIVELADKAQNSPATQRSPQSQ